METQKIIDSILNYTNGLRATKLHEYDGGISVLLKHPNTNLTFWIDCWIDEKYHDILTNWNQYIFYTDNEEDNLKKAIQENSDIFELFSSVAIDFLVDWEKLEQDVNGGWHWKTKTDEEKLEDQKLTVYDTLEYEYFYNEDLLDVINDIMNDMQELTIDEFTRELDWQLDNDYDGRIKWAILENYTSPLEDYENKFEKAKDDLIKDFNEIIENI